MCISPIQIKNPNYGLSLEDFPGLAYKDRTSLYINVPCGTCSECISTRQSGFVQRVQMEGKENYLFFVTLTYNNEMIPRLTDSTGRTYQYADVKDVADMFKRIRKYNAFGRSFKYVGVIELGTKKGRPHFHLLLSLPKMKSDDVFDVLSLEKTLYDTIKSQWVRNVAISKCKDGSIRANTRKPKYVPLFTYKKKCLNGRIYTNYDCHLIRDKFGDDGSASVGYYVCKYMLKPSKFVKSRYVQIFNELPPEEAKYVWSKVKTRSFRSLNFGANRSALAFIHDCIDKSLNDGYEFPQYFNPVSGNPSPLTRYYRNKVFHNVVDPDLPWFDDTIKKDSIQNEHIPFYPPEAFKVFFKRSHRDDDLPGMPLGNPDDIRFKNSLIRTHDFLEYEKLNPDLFDILEEFD